jgi:hypothetical protein
MTENAVKFRLCGLKLHNTIAVFIITGLNTTYGLLITKTVLSIFDLQ